ncbi:MAG: phosphatase PAP2 family protein [Ruminococcaceae bacterium]|nr:phosphatase PAP2 family protein [Oscillospiraceae bacterium]
MKKENRRLFFLPILLLAAFGVWTVLTVTVDVRPIGPEGSRVGLAGINGFVHRTVGVHMGLYTLTDWLGLVPVGICLGFALLGLGQWIKRRRLCRVDGDVLLLGVFYLVVFGVYLLFEELAVNRRPVVIEGFLEASYPSSTTLLVLCVVPTAIICLKGRIKRLWLRRTVVLGLWAFALFMTLGRFVSGVHWLGDIVGGILLSGGLVTAYRAVLRSVFCKADRRAALPPPGRD